MTILILLYILCICRFSEETPSTGLTLDLASPDISKISSRDRNTQTVNCKIYEPKSGSSITSVVDNGREVWKATGNEKSKAVSLFPKGPAKFLALYFEGDASEPKYFGNNGQEWKGIEKSQFDKGLVGQEWTNTGDDNNEPYNQGGKNVNSQGEYEYIIREPPPKPMGKEVPNPFYNPSDPGILNLKNPDTTAFQCINCHVDSVSTRLYMPNECHAIKNVVVDGVELWKGTYCPLVLLHHLDNKPVFVRIITEDPTGISDVLYEVKNDGKWTKIPSNTKMNSLKDITKTTTGLILDINLPPSSIDQVKTRWYGLDVQLFVPDVQYYASEVCLSSEHIWRGRKDDKCTFIIVHLEHEIPITVHLLVRDKNGVVTSLYFVRDGLFKTSNNMEYYNKISVVRRETCKCQQWACCV